MGIAAGSAGAVRSVCGLVGGQCRALRSEGVAGCSCGSVQGRIWDGDGKEPGVRGGDGAADGVTVGMVRNDVEACAGARSEQSTSPGRQESIQ